MLGEEQFKGLLQTFTSSASADAESETEKPLQITSTQSARLFLAGCSFCSIFQAF